MTSIKQLNLTIANAYLIEGKEPILVDSGGPTSLEVLQRALKAHGVTPRDLRLIIHTHGHGDHAGNTTALIRLANVPTAMHLNDLPMAKKGLNAPVHYTRLGSRIIAPFVIRPFEGFLPTIKLDAAFSLREYGVRADVIHTPGHTPGSISIVFDNGEAIVGDIMMGGHLGGMIRPHIPRYHYFYDNMSQLHQSIGLLLKRGVKRFYVGHGGAIEHEAVVQWLKDKAVYSPFRAHYSKTQF